MSPRELSIPPKKTTTAAAPSADKYVDATAPAVDPAEPVRKLSLMFPESDHRATKSGAAARGRTMIAEILELSRARNRSAEGFRWPDDVVASVLAQVEADRKAAEDAAEAEAAPARTRRPAAKRTTTAKRRTA